MSKSELEVFLTKLYNETFEYPISLLVREAIRKVNGATTSQVLSLLSLNISWVVIPAVVIGVAGAVWGGMKYLEMLETMCEPLAWWIFAGGAAVVIAIVYVILIIRTWRTANANPIDMIKIE